MVSLRARPPMGSGARLSSPRDAMTSRPRQSLVMAIIAAVLLVTAPASADPELVARRLVHLFGYIGADYPAAVSDGQVVSPFELEEQLRLLDLADRLAAELEGDGIAVGLRAEVRALRARVDARAPEAEV